MPRCAKILDSGYQCKRTAETGSKYCWQHQGTHQSLKLTPKRPQTKRISPSSKESRTVVPKSSGVHYLTFAEPMTYNGQRPVQPIEVNDKMYNIIKNGPTETFYEKEQINERLNKYKFKEQCTGNAYVFGPLFPASKYVEIASHGNDVAGTGLIDIEINKYKPTTDEELYEEIGQKYNYDWNNRAVLRAFQRKYPEILWIGETYGGDIGASAYAHYDNNGEIDSLIIDTSCLLHD